MKAQHEHTKVLISGAGPAGLVSALLLARLGIRSILIERNPVTDEHPKAHELNARSVEILREIGVTEEDLNREASPLEDGSRILFCRTINEEFGRIDLMADPARKAKYAEHLRQSLPYFNLSQSEFEKILVARAEASDLIDLRFRHSWEALVKNDKQSTVSRILDEAKAATYEIEADFLLACDGAGSPIRRALEIEFEGPAEVASFVNAYFKYNLRDHLKTAAKLYWIAHPKYAGSFIAHHIEKRWVFAVPFYRQWETLDDFSPEFFKKRIQGALGCDLPNFEIESISPWRMSAQVAKTYSANRVFLVGDAAHRFPPTGGLGMNTGIPDAHNLIWKLVSVLKGHSSEKLLDTYESERRPVAVTNCEESRENSENIMEVFTLLGLDLDGMEKLAKAKASFPLRLLPEKLRDKIISIVMDIADRKLQRVFSDPELKKQADETVERQLGHFDRLGLDIGYTYEEGALIDDGTPVEIAENEVSDYQPSTRPGARLPHAWIETPEGRKSTHDFLAYDRFTLFVESELEGTAATSSGDRVQTIDVSDWKDSPRAWNGSLLVRPDGHVAWRGARWKSEYLDQIILGERSPETKSAGVST